MSTARDPDRGVMGSIRPRLADWKTWYHVPVLGLVVAFMLWVRLQAYERFLVAGQVFYSGNDAYYHFREVMYVVTHWPWTMPFDPWTHFPYGTAQGQFGTLFDQLIATAALIVGLGQPSEHTIAVVHLVAPTVFGAATAIPVYGMGKRLVDRPTGIAAAVVLAALPGTFLSRTTVGFTDHNSAEPFFQAVAILALWMAIQVAEREKPVFEQVLDRDWNGLREPVAWSAAAGIALFLYVWVWPPAVFLIGLLGVFYATALSYDYVSGRSPEHVALTGLVLSVVVFVLSLLRLDSLSMDPTAVSAPHLLLSAGLGFGCVFMAVLAREWDKRDLSTMGYPATIAATILVAAGLASVVLPDFFRTLTNNVARIFAFGQSDTTLTVGEARAAPLGELVPFLVGEYGLAFLTAAAGLAWLLVRLYSREDYSAVSVFVAVWAVATTMMALTQVRFNYYLALVVALLTAFLLSRILDVIGLRSLDDLRNVQGYQLLTLLAVLIVLFLPLTPLVAGPGTVEVARSTGPGSSVDWGAGLHWMSTNTPPEGQYGGATNDLAYYGTFERTGDYDYPEGAYGVMSWWDYGHWITVMGERIPNANPFQQGPRPASAYLQASNETRANLMLEALPTTSNAYGLSTAELRDLVVDQSAQEAHEDTRYVVIDDQMAGGKFTAIATWTGPGSDAYIERTRYSVEGQNVSIPATNQRYDDTMLAKLYFEDGSELSHYRLVHEVDRYSVVGGHVQGNRVRPLRRLPLRGDWQALQQTANQLRAAKQSNQLVRIGEGQYVYDAEVESRVKLYERVEGATLTGTAPDAQEGAIVLAFVQMQTSGGRNFSYIQQTPVGPDGSFEMTVPYATDDTVGPDDGGTNTSVRATGPYDVVVGNPFTPSATGRTAVPEEAIYQGREIQVDLEPTASRNASTNGSGSDGGGSAGSLVTDTPTESAGS